MLKFLREEYVNKNEKKINFGLYSREFEEDLVTLVVNSFKSINSVIPEIELVRWDYIIDAEKIDQSEYERTRSNKTKEIEQKYAYVSETRAGELKLTFKVSIPDEGREFIYKRKLLIPIVDEQGYLEIRGKRYVSQYQLVETSTFSTTSTLTLRSLMPISIYRSTTEVDDIGGETFKVNQFNVLMFNRFVNILYFYTAQFGWQGAMDYLGVSDRMWLTDHVDNDKDEYTYIVIKKNMYVKVLSRMMTNHYYQSILGCIRNILTSHMSIEEIQPAEFWVRKIGALKVGTDKAAHYELGSRYLILFNRMLDETNKKVLRLTGYNKNNVFAIVRWLCQNYEILKKKDNLDLLNKRLRCNEYIASLVNGVISDKIKMFVNNPVNENLKDKLPEKPGDEPEYIKRWITKFDHFFNFKGSEIISKLHASGLVKNDDIVNDADFFQKFKMTMKGPNSLGNKNSRNIAAKYRAPHPSHIGKIDLNFCSSSDPGLTNYISPFCETEGLYFKGVAPEPEEFEFRVREELGLIEHPDLLSFDPVKFNNILEFVSTVEIKKGDNDDKINN